MNLKTLRNEMILNKIINWWNKVILLKEKEIIKYLKLGKISDDTLSSDIIWINKGN